MGEIEITTDQARVDVDVVHRFLSESAYWALGRSRATVEQSIRNSLCFSVLCEGGQVGFARVVSDRAVFAYLMDVFILPPWRGQGAMRTDPGCARTSRQGSTVQFGYSQARATRGKLGPM